MKKRIAAWVILVVMLVAAVPAAWAAAIGQVEDFGVEREGAVITVTPPEGYAEKGYYKLFWKNEETGEIKSEVFPADTPSFRIDAEEGAEYSFQLHYAKQKGKLPSVWKTEKPAPTPAGPSLWKVLWIDTPTVDFRGITNHMSEGNCEASGEVARGFEALVEELSEGRVDIQITRMTLEEPITELSYIPDFGYYISPDSFDMKHYAMRKYDSVFVFGRFEHILRRFDGVTVQTENPREYPGFTFMPLFGDDIELSGGIKYLTDVSVHEWIHQLGYLYETYQLEIPNPDTPEIYGYPAVDDGGNIDHTLFRDALTMKAVSPDGRYIGVPEEAWQYKPTKYAHRNLSAMQQEMVPGFQARQEEPAPDEQAVPNVDPVVLGELDEETGIYTNTYMGLTFAPEGWVFYDAVPYNTSTADISEDDPDYIKNDNTFMTMFAADSAEPVNVSLYVNTSAVPFFLENGAEAWLLDLQKYYERWAVQYEIPEYSCELIERAVGGRTLPGIRYRYITRDIDCWQETLVWLDGDHLDTLVVDSFMFDLCKDPLEHFAWLE